MPGGTWRRLGVIFAPADVGAARHPLLATHAALPVGVPLGGDLVRVFYSGRDAANRSSLGTLVLRLGDPPRVEDAPPAPVLTPGGIGAFDDAGIGMGCVVCVDGGDRLYYMGWNVGGSVPWRNAIGLAIGDARAGRFERYAVGPILDRGPVDPFSLSYPWVLHRGAGDWRMWYGTHLAWGAAKTDMSHAIRAARSKDGLAWERETTVTLAPQGQEIALVRPCVLPDGPDGAEMWFACRTESGPYRLGHARSQDLRRWTRDSDGLLDPAPAGFEGGAVTYPSVLDAVGRRWLFYNGAGYGRSGIGLAVWDQG